MRRPSLRAPLATAPAPAAAAESPRTAPAACRPRTGPCAWPRPARPPRPAAAASRRCEDGAQARHGAQKHERDQPPAQAMEQAPHRPSAIPRPLRRSGGKIRVAAHLARHDLLTSVSSRLFLFSWACPLHPEAQSMAHARGESTAATSRIRRRFGSRGRSSPHRTPGVAGMTKTSTRALILPTISTSGINSAELSPSINSMYVASTPTWPKVGSVVSRSLIPGAATTVPWERGKGPTPNQSGCPEEPLDSILRRLKRPRSIRPSCRQLAHWSVDHCSWPAHYLHIFGSETGFLIPEGYAHEEAI